VKREKRRGVPQKIEEESYKGKGGGKKIEGVVRVNVISRQLLTTQRITRVKEGNRKREVSVLLI